jgi:hypothetical protein
MSYTPDSPNSENVPGPPVAQGLNKLHILRMDIQLVPDDAASTKVEVTWAEGYMDGDTYKPVKRHVDLLAGEDVATKLAELTTGGSIYGEVKAALWDLMQARGLVGAGTVG